MNTNVSPPDEAFELASSDAEYRVLVENAGDLVVKVDRDGRFLYVSPSYCELFGKSTEDLLGHAFMPMVHEDDQDATLKAMKTLTCPPYTAYIEQRAMTRSGWCWLAWSDKAVLDESGQVSAIIGLGRNITEKKRMELALRESEERFRSFFEQSADCYFVLDLEGRLIDVNKRMLEIFGYTREEMLDLRIEDVFLDSGQADSIEYAVSEQLRIDGSVQFEGEFRNKYNEILHGEIVSSIVDVGGEKLIQGILRDITENKLAKESLLEEQNRINDILEGTNAGTWDWNVQAGELTINARWAEIIGYTYDELKPISVETWRESVCPDDLPAVSAVLERHFVGDLDYYDVEFRQSHKDGRWVWVNARGKVVEWTEDGMPLRMSGTHLDISERKRAEEQRQLAANVFTYAREGILITDLEGTILNVNDAFSRITGYPRDEVLGKNPRILQSGYHGKDFYSALWRDLIKDGHWHGEIWNQRKNGELFVEMLTISAVKDTWGKMQHYVALFTDITAQKEHQSQLEHIAHHDALTNLPNRVLLSYRLLQAMEETRLCGLRLVLGYLDLDGFKAVNDVHGHEVGDQLLIAVAGRMKEILRRGDTVARLGGDEFVILFSNIGQDEDYVPMLNRLLAAVADPVSVSELVLQVSGSLGLTVYPQVDDVDADQLLRQADQAMYQAKLAGKNCYHVFDDERDRSARGRHESLEDIRRALAEPEFILRYQPKVNMRTGRVIGTEALIRWQHPDRGFLLPSHFLPVIENHWLAAKLGEWVIDTALTQLEVWKRAGLDLPVSVNIGAYQLQKSDFIVRLRALLAAHPAVKPESLELEVLETSALKDLDQVSGVMHACREMGVRFALDDFGTGYSSLTYLKRLPAAQIKIDRSFVHDMLDDPDDLAIIEGVLGLTTTFRRQPIAEGVETVEHGVVLLQLGCELAQGYGIAHPMLAADLPDWVDAWRPDPRWIDQHPIKAEDLPMLFAGVELRAWIRAIEAFIKGERTEPPRLDHQQCRFGQWLDGTGQARHSARPAFRIIESLHRQVHLLADQLLEFQVRARHPDALAGLDELFALRDVVLKQLDVLAQESVR